MKETKDKVIVNRAVPLKDAGFWASTCKNFQESKNDALKWVGFGVDMATTPFAFQGVKSAIATSVLGALTKEGASYYMGNSAALQEPAQICAAITGAKVNGMSYEYAPETHTLYLVMPEPGKSHDTLLEITTPQDFHPGTNPLLNPQFEKKGLFECADPNTDLSLRQQWEHRLNCDVNREKSLRQIEGFIHEPKKPDVATDSKPLQRGPSSVGPIIEDESLKKDEDKAKTQNTYKDNQEKYQSLMMDLQFLQSGISGFSMYAESTGNRDLKIASQLASTALQAAGAMIALISLIGGMSCLGPLGALAGAVFALFSIFNKSNEKSPEQIIQEALVEIQKQLGDFRRENAEALGRLGRQQLHALEVIEARLDHLAHTVVFGFYQLQRSLVQLIEDVHSGFDQLSKQIQLDAITVYLRPFQKIIFKAQKRLHPEEAEAEDQNIADELSRWLMQAACDDVGTGYNYLKSLGDNIWTKLYSFAAGNGTYDFTQDQYLFYHFMRLWSAVASQFLSKEEDKALRSTLNSLAPNIMVFTSAAASLADLEYGLKLNFSRPAYDQRLFAYSLQIKNWHDAWLALRRPDFFAAIHEQYQKTLDTFNQEFENETEFWKREWHANLKVKGDFQQVIDPLKTLQENCQELSSMDPLFFDSFIETDTLVKVDHIQSKEVKLDVINSLRAHWFNKHDKWPVQFLQKLFSDPGLEKSNRRLSSLFTLAQITSMGKWKFSLETLKSVLPENANLDFPYHKDAKNPFNHPPYWRMEVALKMVDADESDNEITKFDLKGEFPKDNISFATSEGTQGEEARNYYLRGVIDGIWATYQKPKEFDLHALSTQSQQKYSKKLTTYFMATRCAYAEHMNKWMDGVGKRYVDALGSITTFLHAIIYLLFPEQYQEIKDHYLQDYLDMPRLKQRVAAYIAQQQAFLNNPGTLPWPEGYFRFTAPKPSHEVLLKKWQKPSANTTATKSLPPHPLAMVNQGIEILLDHLAKKADFTRRYPTFVKRVNWERRQALETYSALDSRLGHIIGLLERLINESFLRATAPGIYTHAGLSADELWHDFLQRAKLIAERPYIDATQKVQVEMFGQNEAQLILNLAQEKERLEPSLLFAENVLSHRKFAFASKEASAIIFHSNANLYEKMLGVDQEMHVPLWIQGASATMQLVREYYAELFIHQGLPKDDPHILNFIRQADERFKTLLSSANANPYKAQQYLLLHKLEPKVIQKLAQGYQRICKELLEPAQGSSGAQAEKWRELSSKSLAALSVLIAIFINTLYEPEEAPDPEEFKRLQKFFVTASEPAFYEDQTASNLLKELINFTLLVQGLADTYTSVLVFVKYLVSQINQDAVLFIDGDTLSLELAKFTGKDQTIFELKPEHLLVLDKLLEQHVILGGLSFKFIRLSERFFASSSTADKFYSFFKKHQFKILCLNLDNVVWPKQHSALFYITHLLNSLPWLESLSLQNISLAQEGNIAERFSLAESLNQLKALQILHLRNLNMSYALLECLVAHLPSLLQTLVIEGHASDKRVLFNQGMRNVSADLSQLVLKIVSSDIKVLTSIFTHCPLLKALDWPDLKTNVEDLRSKMGWWPELAYCNFASKEEPQAAQKIAVSKAQQPHEELMQLLTKEVLKTIRELIFFPAPALAQILKELEDIQTHGMNACFDKRRSVFIGDWSLFNIPKGHNQSAVKSASPYSKLK